MLRPLTLALALAAGMVVAAQAPAPRTPAEAMSFRGAGWLEREDRDEQEQPAKVLEALGLKSGDVVADVGCGSGYFARRLAPRIAPSGKVYCVDIQPEMLDIMKDLASRDDVTGIVPVLGTMDDPRLPKGEADWILLADVYHELARPAPMLARLREALAPGGKVALIEYRMEDGSGDAIKADHRMSVRQVLAEWKPAHVLRFDEGRARHAGAARRLRHAVRSWLADVDREGGRRAARQARGGRRGSLHDSSRGAGRAAAPAAARGASTDRGGTRGAPVPSSAGT